MLMTRAVLLTVLFINIIGSYLVAVRIERFYYKYGKLLTIVHVAQILALFVVIEIVFREIM